MGLSQQFLFGLLFGIALMGCAGASFGFKYYGIAQVDYTKGMLLGPTPSDDLAFSQCEPNSIQKNPCVIMLTRDFFALKQDYLDLKMRLQSCEKVGGLNQDG